MRLPVELVSHAFRHPDTVRQFSMGDWDRLVHQARQAALLARMHSHLQDHAVDCAIPEPARWHFETAGFLAETQQSDVRRQLRQLRAQLDGLDIPLIALKGAAYTAANLAAARGRQVDAIDLLVPRKRLDEIGSILQQAGWREIPLPAYEGRHRRRWCHDAQPLQHLRHAALIDLHHTMLPDGARFRPDAARMRRQATEIAGLPGIAILSAEDCILHAVTALLHDDRLPTGMRDLSDIDLLLRAEAANAEFWRRLLARAEEQDLQRPVFYALRYARRFFATPVPGEVEDNLASAAPGAAALRIMDAAFGRMLTPRHPTCADSLTPLARRAIYVHSHWLRRPPRQLLPHLLRKTFAAPQWREPNPA